MAISKCLRLSQIGAAGLLAFSALSAQATSWYQIQLLETPTGTAIRPEAINDAGAIVGDARFADVAYLWQSGSAQPLPSLRSGAPTHAAGINTQGQIAGSSGGDAVIWEQSQIKPLPWGESEAEAINDAGTVVGQSGRQAVMWQGGQLLVLPSADHALESFAYDVSESGIVVGTAHGSILNETENWYQALRWDGDQLTVLRAGPGAATLAVGVNDLGSVVGNAYNPYAASKNSAVRWDGEVATLLNPIAGMDDSSAFGINNMGLVVGFSNTGAESRATLWEDNAAIDLTLMLTNGQGWNLWQATGINNKGQIIGFGAYEGRWAGYLLTPVPEANSWLMVALGLPVAWATRRLKRPQKRT